MTYERIAARLRLARERAQISQLDVAGHVGISRAALSQYESGARRIDAVMLDRLARLYGVPISFMFADVDQGPDWEQALRLQAGQLTSIEAKQGVWKLIELMNNLEELYERLHVPRPGVPHPSFEVISDNVTADRVVLLAQAARNRFGLGDAPIRDLSGFLENEGYLIFSISFGQPDDLSGLFFMHPSFGPVIAINSDRAFTRRAFTLAHEFAHGLFHYDRPAILCRSATSQPVERVANQFAACFLIPLPTLTEQIARMGREKIDQPEDIVRLARHFGVSFHAMVLRLAMIGRLHGDAASYSDVRPVVLARSLGYQTSEYEFGKHQLPVEMRFPRIYFAMVHRAAGEQVISESRAAEMLEISELEMQGRLYDNPSDIEVDDGLREMEEDIWLRDEMSTM